LETWEQASNNRKFPIFGDIGQANLEAQTTAGRIWRDAKSCLGDTLPWSRKSSIARGQQMRSCATLPSRGCERSRTTLMSTGWLMT